MGRLANLNTEELGRQIGEGLLASTKRRFKEGRGPDGKRWPPSTRVKEKGGQTLVRTRRLERSITYKVSPGKVEIGTNDKRADVHQSGRTIRARRAKALKFRVGRRWVQVKSVKMPARPFIGISKADSEMIDETIMAEIGEQLK